MKGILRLAIVSSVSTAALAFAGNALATQRLAVSQTATGVTIKVSQDQSDPQPHKITAYVPTGYQLKPTGAPGTTIGTASGQIFVTDPNVNAVLPLSGDVSVADQSTLPPEQVDACSPGPHLAIWDVRLTVAGQTLDLIVYVSATSGSETAFGAAKLELCLPPVDVPLGTPGRSPNGAKLLDATFTVNNQVTPPTGSARWSSTWIPYAAGTGLPDTAGEVEARAIVGPGAVTIKSKLVRKRRTVTLSGRVTQSGLGVGNIIVRLLLNSKPRYKHTTSSSGAYVFVLRKRLHFRVATTFFQAMVAVKARDVTGTGCASPTPGIRCVSATAGPFTARSRRVRVVL